MAEAFAGPLSRRFALRAGEDPARFVPGVEAWQRDLRSSVADKVAAELEWDERKDVAVRADLGEAGFQALRLFAFYAERSDLEWPDTVPPLNELDPHWREAADQKFGKSLYGQLLACELWLPGEFPVTLRAPRPDGETVEIGSLTVLHDQLMWLNQRTFQADRDVVATWARLPATPGGDLLEAARRGYCGLWAAADAARREHVPLAVVT